MSSQPHDNTGKLISTGLFTVLLPTAVALFGPLALAAIWIFGAGKFLLWPLFAGMLAGLVLSFFFYRFSSARWLRWALNQSNNLARLKRKAIKNGLISERGMAVFDSSYFLDDETLSAFEKIDHSKAQADNVSVPPFVQLYTTTGGKAIGIIAMLLFIIPAVFLIIFLPEEERWSVLKFSPLLLVGIIFLSVKGGKQLLMEADSKGIRTAKKEWNWPEIKSAHHIRRQNIISAPGRGGFHAASINILLLKTTSGETVTIPLDTVSIKFDLEEYIAVYRLRYTDLVNQ